MKKLPAVCRAAAALVEFRSLGVEGFWSQQTLFLKLGVQLEVRRESSTLVLENFWTSPSLRGRGHATIALGVLCRVADRWQVSIRLRAVPFDAKRGAPSRNVREWYARAGFEPEERRNGRRMIRRARDHVFLAPLVVPDSGLRPRPRTMSPLRKAHAR